MSDIRLFPEGIPIHVEPCDELSYLATMAGESAITVYGHGDTEAEAVAEFLLTFGETYADFRRFGEAHLGQALIAEYREMRRWIYGPASG